MTTLNQWKTWVKKLGYAEKPRAERRAPEGITARPRNRATAKPATVRDISSTGLQLLTEERWPVGELVSLSVEVERLSENPSEPQITVQAKVMRHTGDGVGLRFVLPEGLDPEIWAALLTSAILLEGPKDALYTLKVLRAVLFVSRLCHAEGREAIMLLGGELDQHRTSKAIEITHRAEDLLDAEPDTDKMRADPKLIKSILKDGSWSDGLTEQMWAGLLASSCTASGKDDSNKAFAGLVVNISNTQCRIFLSACRKARELGAGTGKSDAGRVTCTPKQMVRLSGMVDVGRIGTDVSRLFNAGVLEKNFDFTSYIPTESFDVTPTPLGMELYQRCKGDSIQLDTPVVGAIAAPSWAKAGT
jgi:hypothetical protein